MMDAATYIVIFVATWGLIISWTYFLWKISQHLEDIAFELRERRREAKSVET